MVRNDLTQFTNATGEVNNTVCPSTLTYSAWIIQVGAEVYSFTLEDDGHTILNSRPSTLGISGSTTTIGFFILSIKRADKSRLITGTSN